MADVSSRRRGGFTGTRGRAARSAPYSAGSAAPYGSWKREVDGAGAGGGGSRSTEGPFERLVVTNLHYEVMPSDLKGIFESIGNLAREPTIRYDRSGRSTGTAWVHFLNPNDAELAKARLNGVSAKGQPMKIEIEAARPPRDVTRTGPGGKLISRIGSLPLLDRMKSPTGDISAQRRRPLPPRGDRPKSGIALNRPTVAARAPRTPNVPKTAEDLDRELDAYLKDDDSGVKQTTQKLSSVTGGDDVEMQ